MTGKKKILSAIILIISLVVIIFTIVSITSTNNMNYIDKLIRKYNPQGAAVGVIKNGKVHSIKNYGYSNLENKIPISTETQFKIASISKTITAYAVMQLVDEGKLNLDKPISTYLTKWNLPNTQFDENKVTLRTLMSHTSGITGSDEYGYTYPLPSIESVLKSRDIKLKRKPGEAFEYSEFAGFGICQLIIQEVTGEKFEDYMESNIFKKLNMYNTNYLNTSNNNSFATPYAGFGRSLQITPIVMNGGGGVSTTASDLSKFTIELINYYNRSNKEMFTSQKNTESSGGTYALGIIPRKLKNGKTVYEHNGTLTGWNAQMVMEPTGKNGIVILTNSDKAYYLTYELMEKWGELTLGEKIIDTQIDQIPSFIYKAIGVLVSILILLVIIFYVKIKKGILVLTERSKRYKRCTFSTVICLVLASLYFLTFYTQVPFKILFNMSDYYLFTFLPPCFVWINALLGIYAILIICISGYTKVKNQTTKIYA